MILDKIFIILGYLKIFIYKLLYGKKIRIDYNSKIFRNFNLYIGKKAKVNFGSNFICRNNAEIRVNNNAILNIEDNVFFNSNLCITVKNKITIGENTIIGQNVSFYDHDHIYKNIDGKFSTSGFEVGEIRIGKNVWIGSGVIILNNTIVGDNCVIGAGSILKGSYPSNSLIYNKKETYIKRIDDERKHF